MIENFTVNVQDKNKTDPELSGYFTLYLTVIGDVWFLHRNARLIFSSPESMIKSFSKNSGAALLLHLRLQIAYHSV